MGVVQPVVDDGCRSAARRRRGRPHNRAQDPPPDRRPADEADGKLIVMRRDGQTGSAGGARKRLGGRDCRIDLLEPRVGGRRGAHGFPRQGRCRLAPIGGEAAPLAAVARRRGRCCAPAPRTDRSARSGGPARPRDRCLPHPSARPARSSRRDRVDRSIGSQNVVVRHTLSHFGYWRRARSVPDGSRIQVACGQPHRARSTHLIGCPDAEQAKPRGQNCDNALHQGKTSRGH